MRCFNCGGDCKISYDIEGNPHTTRCNKCNAKAHRIMHDVGKQIIIDSINNENKRIAEKKKELNGKEPYEVLAKLKMMLKRSKKHFVQSKNGWWVSPAAIDAKESILQECYDILDAYEIPSKYLIAETLDHED